MNRMDGMRAAPPGGLHHPARLNTGIISHRPADGGVLTLLHPGVNTTLAWTGYSAETRTRAALTSRAAFSPVLTAFPPFWPF